MLLSPGDMTVEELASKYAGAYASDFELPDTPSSSEPEEASDNDDLDLDGEHDCSAGHGERQWSLTSLPICPG